MFGFGKKKEESSKCELLAVMNGKSIDITTLPDPVFAEKVLGDGFAVDPADGTVVSPVSGRIIDVQDSHHAYGIQTENGLEILVHIGINTVEMNGEGFTPFVKVGDKVKAGQKLCEADLNKIKEAGFPTFTIVLITNIDEVSNINVNYTNTTAGETVVLTCEKNI